MWWRFLTDGFVHDPHDLQHIIFNMLVLFFLGRDVEGGTERGDSSACTW